MDFARFLAENEVCLARPFRTDKPRAGLTLGFDEHWLFEELALESTVRYYRDPGYRVAANVEANNRIDGAIGLRPFDERPPRIPPLRIEEVFGCRQELLEGGTPWLEPTLGTAEELAAKLDEVEALSDDALLALVLSTGAILESSPGSRVAWSRGPTTVGTSALGTTEFLMLLLDEPDLMGRFYDVLATTLIRYHRVLAAAQGADVRGFAWLDDNCALLSPDLYERYAYPAMRRVFEAFCPRADDYRFQHSDSAMEHLLPVLARYGLHGCNFGPTVGVVAIRAAMPRTVIHGQLAPFTLRNGTRETVRAEVLRDFRAVGSDGGLVVTTAGSIAAGTRLESLRWLIEIVDADCRYG
ncbi:MAG: hypothetical protein KIS66_10190 [Fimbriimonadaceae bacterium]|nr:hypothetical protein [Fimbriimonadaceae bacterium]